MAVRSGGSSRFANPGARRGALIAFSALVALTGGGARADILSLVVLRPVAVLFAGYAILAAPRGAVRTACGPLLLLALCALVIAIHLVPLPPAMWRSMPGREGVARLDDALGMADIWRSLALSPAGAWNAMFSLVVPGAAILLYAAIEQKDRGIVLFIWLAVALVSALLGVAQLLGDPRGVLYLYAITSTGLPVGLFSNANHHAMVLAAAIPLASQLPGRGRGGNPNARNIAGAALALLFLFVALLTGSRAGTALSLAAMMLAAAVFTTRWLGASSRASGNVAGRPVKTALANRQVAVSLAVLGGALVAVVGAVAAFSTTGVGFAALLHGGEKEELRLTALPTLLTMLAGVAPVGVGAGSFAPAYQMYEPLAALTPHYLNHAHNDFLEPSIEYGVAGLLFVLALVTAVLRVATGFWRDWRDLAVDRLALLAPLAVFALSSVVDYPLRVPLVQVLTILWFMALRDRAAVPLPSGRKRRS